MYLSTIFKHDTFTGIARLFNHDKNIVQNVVILVWWIILRGARKVILVALATIVDESYRVIWELLQRNNLTIIIS